MPPRFSRTASASALATIMAVHSSPLFAQEGDDSKLETMEVIGTKQQAYLVDQAKAGTKLQLSLKDTPQSVSVITSAQLNDFNLTDMNAALQTAAGINVQAVETDRTYYTARGFEVNNFQVDGLGMPLLSGNTHGDLDTALYQRIDVLRGANGLMTGVGNPSATINMVRKRPTKDSQANVSLSAGSWNTLRFVGDVSGELTDDVRARAVMVKQNGDSYLDRNSDEKTTLYGVVEADVSSSSVLTAGVSYQQHNASGNLWGALPLYYTDGSATNYDRATSTSADWSFWNVEDLRGFVELAQELSEGWTLTAAYNYAKTNEDSELFYVYGTPNKETEAGLTGYASEYLLDDEQHVFDLYVNGGFNFAGREHELVVGASAAKHEYTDHSLYDYTNGFPPIENLTTWDGKTVAMTFADGPNGSDVDYSQNAVYATARFNVFDGAHLITGVRFNQWTAEGTAYGSEETTDFKEPIPYIGATYEFSPTVSGYASYTQTLVAQVERDASNNRLAPLEGDNLEAGIKAALFGEKLLATAAVFSVEQRNLPVCDDRSEDTLVLCGTTDAVYIGTEATSQGVELELTGEVSEGWQVSASYTYQELESKDEASKIDEYTPQNLLRASSTYQLPSVPALTVGANLSWQSDTYRNQGVVGAGFDNEGEDIVSRQDAYAIVDLMASYAINDRLKASLNINNISDEKYLTSLYWAQGYYGAPRNVTVKLAWSL